MKGAKETGSQASSAANIQNLDSKCCAAGPGVSIKGLRLQVLGARTKRERWGRHSEPGETQPNARTGFNFAQELDLGGGGLVRPVMSEKQPGIQIGLRRDSLQLPRSCLQLGPWPRIWHSMLAESQDTST